MLIRATLLSRREVVLWFSLPARPTWFPAIRMALLIILFATDCVGTTELVSLASDGAQGNDAIGDGSISADGNYFVFESLSTNLVPGDTNGWADIFVRGYGLPYSLYLPAIVH